MLQLKEMVLALLDESDLDITTDAVEMIVDRTFDQADTKGAGRGSIKKNGQHLLKIIHMY